MPTPTESGLTLQTAQNIRRLVENCDRDPETRLPRNREVGQRAISVIHQAMSNALDQHLSLTTFEPKVAAQINELRPKILNSLVSYTLMIRFWDPNESPDEIRDDLQEALEESLEPESLQEIAESPAQVRPFTVDDLYQAYEEDKRTQEMENVVVPDLSQFREQNPN